MGEAADNRRLDDDEQRRKPNSRRERKELKHVYKSLYLIENNTEKY